MRLIVQIPCFNEEESIAKTLGMIPKKFPMIDQVEVLVIDDGSTDQTAEIAKAHPVDHLVSLGKHCGLSAAFSAGLKTSLALGADLVVNIDADNQYFSEDIEKLLLPLVGGEMDMVIGERPQQRIHNLSIVRQWLHKIGTWVLQKASGTKVSDPTSGFRAFSRRGAQSMIVSNDYTYTLETIIRAGRTGLPMTFVPIRSRSATRESRLIKSLPIYILKQGIIVVRTTLPYLINGSAKLLKKTPAWNQIKSGNLFNKHSSQKLSARLAMRGFRACLLELAKMTGVKRAHELGCGEGHLMSFLSQQGFETSGSDVCEKVIQIARKNNSPNPQFTHRDLLKLKPGEACAPLIICCEVLEHLEDPVFALLTISKVASPWAIFSVPREPIWRILNFICLRYIASFGNTPGHTHHWNSREFLKMVEKNFEIVAMRKPLPWTMILAKRKIDVKMGSRFDNK